jgi:NAD(P)-dependent dehydrogenase (short-subunit alcohol dehydrogenase family)
VTVRPSSYVGVPPVSTCSLRAGQSPYAPAVSTRFADRFALVTGGAGSGIGSATCRRLAAEGAAVVVVDSHDRRTDAVAAELRASYGVPIRSAVLDVADRDAVDALIDSIAADLGPIDLLVNNAAINTQGSVFDYDPLVWDEVLRVDLTACWYLIRGVLPGMRDAGRGSIVNVTSVSGWTGGRGREGAYSAAKAALHEVTRSVAIEAGPYGIRCNAVAPGWIRSKFLDKHEERVAVERELTPLRRWGSPDEVAAVIAFLCSEDAAFVTGECVNVSGGWYLRP